MKHATGIGVAALLALALTVAAGTAGPKPKVGIAGEWVGADSIRVTATWTAVTDARGAAVTYSWVFYRDGGQVALGATTALSEARTFARPLAGDTARYFAEVTAVDSRGRVSSTARSGTLLVIAPWTPPPPPVIRIDTVAYEPGHPDGLMMYIAPPTWGGRVDVTNGTIALAVGDTVTYCALHWDGGYLRTPKDAVLWSVDSDAISVTPRTSNCALLLALRETNLPAQYPVGP